MHRLRPLSDYPPGTLDALRAAVAALLGYQDMLPTDLYVKLDLFRDDIAKALGPSPRRPSMRPRTPPPPRPGPCPATRTRHDNPTSRKACPMTNHLCTCGYEADDLEDLNIHFGEMFIPADDTAPDGQVHCEAARDKDSTGRTPAPSTLTCRCGFTGTISDFDRHLLAVFAPADRIGLGGKRHAPAASM
jgi:hypothetical protein